MLEFLKKVFGVGPKTDFAELVEQGAIILDVRSKAEFTSGHIKNAINIPVDQLSNSLSRLKNKNKCIICYCASGMRSATAKRILIAKGYKAVFNGGGFYSLQKKL